MRITLNGVTDHIGGALTSCPSFHLVSVWQVHQREAGYLGMVPMNLRLHPLHNILSGNLRDWPWREQRRAPDLMRKAAVAKPDDV
jgi:hypothetical protein